MANSAKDRRRPRREKRGIGHALARAFPEEMRAALAPHLDAYVSELLWDLKNRTIDTGGKELATNSAHRTALDMVPRIMQVIGASEDVLVRALAQLGYRDLAHAEAAARLYQNADGATGDDAERIAVQVIRARLKSDPRAHARLLEACFGVRQVRQEPAAQISNGNGNGNGGPHA